MPDMKRTALLIFGLLILGSTAAGEATLLKRTIYITPQKFLRYWKNPKAAEPVYNTLSWYPNVQFDILGPISSGSKLVVEIDHPGGDLWLTVNMRTSDLADDVYETVKPENMDSNQEEKLASIETG